MNFRNKDLLKHSAIVVHCSATRPSMDIGVKEITEWHKDRNFLTVGYHLVIRRDGSYEYGRDWGTQGAHAGGFNRNPKDGKLTFGICLVGGVKEDNVYQAEDNFTKEQYQSLTKALDMISSFTGISEIVGHNEVQGHASRGCPSFDIKTYRAWFFRAKKSLYLPADWFTYDWKEGLNDDWNAVNLYREINFDKGGAEE